MARQVAGNVGSIDVLINNAGQARPIALDALTVADFDEALAVNLRSAFLVTQAFLPTMRLRSWGRLIFVSSVAAQVGGVVGPHYAASKAGLAGLAHAYAALLAREGITANVVAPALIDTEMVRNNPKAAARVDPRGTLRHSGGGGRGRRVGREQWIHHGPDDQRQRRVVYVVVKAP